MSVKNSLEIVLKNYTLLEPDSSSITFYSTNWWIDPVTFHQEKINVAKSSQHNKYLKLRHGDENFLKISLASFLNSIFSSFKMITNNVDLISPLFLYNLIYLQFINLVCLY